MPFGRCTSVVQQHIVLDGISDLQGKRAFGGRTPTKHATTSDVRKKMIYDSAGRDASMRDRTVPFSRSPASSNESDQLNKNTSASNSGVDGASTSSKSPVIANTPTKQVQTYLLSLQMYITLH